MNFGAVADYPVDPECIFCRIVAGEIPAKIVAESSNIIAFPDIEPAAPMHVLVIPKGHYERIGDLAKAVPGQVAELVELADKVADQEDNGSYRLIFNNGKSAGQGVFHVHGHVVGGKQLHWYPAEAPSH